MDTTRTTAGPAGAPSPKPIPRRSIALHWAAGPVGYVALLCLLAKLARAFELSQRLGSPRPFLIVGATLGHDAIVVAAVGLLVHALGKLRHVGARWGLTLLLLVPIALLLPADLISQLLTGRPITLQRLRGDEGATLKDLDLLAGSDLALGLGGIVLALGLLALALRMGPMVAFLRRAARARVLLLVLLVGFCVSAAQSAFLPRANGLEDQPVIVLLQSLAGGADIAALRLSERQWHDLLRPGDPLARTPDAPPVQAHAKNVVLFLAEGIPYKDTGFDKRLTKRKIQGRKLKNPTPNLVQRWKRHGAIFDRYYANWHASIQAIFSVACSAYPPMNGDIVRFKPRIDCGAMSELLRARDVLPGLFHGGRFNFYNKLALLGRRGNAIEVDADELAKTSKRASHQWGIDDRAMTDALLSWVDTLPRGQRFGALLIPITAHYPYWTPSDFTRLFKQATRQERFLNAVAFQDQVFEEMLRGFEQRGLYDDTLFVWLGDHGHYVGEPERETSGLRGFYQPNIHVPLVLLNSRMFPSDLPAAQRRSERLGTHVDLLPTLLDALGLPLDRRHQGQSLLARDFEQRRAFFGAEDGRYLGFVEGQHKFAIDLHKQRTEYYDLAADPDELTDLSAEHPERMKAYSRVANRFARGVTARIADAPVLRESVSVQKIYELFQEHVRVRLRPDAASPAVDCGRGRGAACPGLGPVVRIHDGKLAGARRRCALVKLPAAGTIELSITHRDTLDLLTGTVVVLPDDARERVSITMTADGVRSGSASAVRGAEVRPPHPKAKRELRFALARTRSEGRAPEVCLQLTALSFP